MYGMALTRLLRLIAGLLFTCTVLPATPASAEAPAATARPENRLSRSNSPYLLLHAKNPVDWYEWGPEALERARTEKKPIFLSIGYSSCFWCHVMERLVFENAEIAAYMNEHFVNIKVDREERPDLDEIYMLGLQVYLSAIGSGQGGGWPLSMFLTPDGRPFAGGTYFPPDDKDGRAGFGTVLRQINDVWTKQPDRINQTADLVTREVQRLSKPALILESVPLSQQLVADAAKSILAAYDAEDGGVDFDSTDPDGAKFPVPTRLELLQTLSAAAGSDPGLTKALDHTLDRMAAGGIYDHLGGGFHRYSTDRHWRVPHFEKMLYDNALLADVYATAYLRTSRKSCRLVAEGIIDFVLRDLTDPQGGFYSALDAETDGVEGKYYVWSKEEITQLLGPDEARLLLSAYGVDEPQRFEIGAVLFLPRPLSETADHLQLPLADLEARLQASREKLLAARQKRSPLLRDDKVLVGWNGLMIRALSRAGTILRRPDYLDAAQKAAVFVLGQVHDKNGRLLHSWRNGQASIPAYLDDYASLTGGLIALHDATGDARWLQAARKLAEQQQSLFWDEAGKGYFFTSSEHEQLFARPKNAFDSVIPSGNSLSARNLVRLAQLTREVGYARQAQETIQAFVGQTKQNPAGNATLLLALHELLASVGTTTELAGPVPGVLSGPPKTFVTDVPGAQAPKMLAGPTPTAPKAPTPPAAPVQPKPPAADAPLIPVATAAKEEAEKHPLLAGQAYLAADALTAGEPTRVALVLQVAPEWHINANPPRPKQMKATEWKGTFAQKSELKDVLYPEGEDFTVEGFDEPLSVYEGKVVIYATIVAPEAAAGQTEDLTFNIRYQACNNETCQRPVSLEIKGQARVNPKGQKGKAINERLFAAPADK
jgi:uncharacterized protein YyaL (SSP411 family)